MHIRISRPQLGLSNFYTLTSIPTWVFYLIFPCPIWDFLISTCFFLHPDFSTWVFSPPISGVFDLILNFHDLNLGFSLLTRSFPTSKFSFSTSTWVSEMMSCDFLTSIGFSRHILGFPHSKSGLFFQSHFELFLPYWGFATWIWTIQLLLDSFNPNLGFLLDFFPFRIWGSLISNYFFLHLRFWAWVFPTSTSGCIA